MRAEDRLAWIVFAAAALISAGLIFYVTSGQTFAVDEFYYYGRMADGADGLIQYHALSLGYLLSPFNGHLTLGGKAIYEVLFAVFGTQYWAFVAVNVIGIVVSAALVFELARRRVGPLVALGPAVLLLFLGFAREQFVWALDFNTSLSLAAGLGAVLALEREDRRGDVLACLLIAFSVAMIEVGLAFLAAIGVWLLLRRERWRRLWIVIVPLVLYAAWWLWARKFHQSQTELSNIVELPKTAFYGLATVMGSLTGTNPVLPASMGSEVTWFGKALAVVATVATAARLWLTRRRLEPTLLIWVVALAVYWALLAVAARPPQASRYILVGAVLVLLVGAEAIWGVRSRVLAAGIAVLVVLALPANIAQLVDDHDHDVLHHDAPVSRAEFAMLGLASNRVDPEYVVSADPRVVDAGGGLYIGMPAGAYLRGAERNGSLGFSLDELRGQSAEIRAIADAALAGALGVELTGAGRAAAAGAGGPCRDARPLPGGRSGEVALPAGRAFLRPLGAAKVAIGVRRFGDPGSAVPLGDVPAGGWTELRIPHDGAPGPWRASFDGPLRVCLSA